MEKSPLRAIGAVLVVLFVVGCVCTVLAMEAFSAIGELAASPFKWLSRQDSGELTLRRVLEDDRQAAFTLGGECEFPYAQGTIFDNRPGADQEGGFVSEITRQEVTGLVGEALRGDIFIVAGGEVRLESGTEVQASLIGTDSVYLIYNEETNTEASSVSRQVEGVLAGNTLSGSFYLVQNNSAVADGRAEQQSITLLVDFVCPVRWLVAH